MVKILTKCHLLKENEQERLVQCHIFVLSIDVTGA